MLIVKSSSEELVVEFSDKARLREPDNEQDEHIYYHHHYPLVPIHPTLLHSGE